MLNKEDFQRAIQDRVSNYPAVALLYHAQDPRILEHLDAMATMLSLLSGQIETAMSEPFVKSRDATVLADAAMRGIVPKSTPARAKIRAENKGGAQVSVDVARLLLDSSGHYWRVVSAATVPPVDVNGNPGVAFFEAEQVKSVVILHTVANSAPFYAIPIPKTEDDAFLSSVSVSSDNGGAYAYRERYVNIGVGERIFHIEADDRQNIYVRFGYKNVVGVQPDNGETITLSLDYSLGEYAPEYGTPFVFEYLASPLETTVEMKMEAVSSPGQMPISLSALRDLARYPSIYEHDAVFLGEFDFLVRRNFPSLKFCSVWNEHAEEQARGANLDNINKLFVACLGAEGAEYTLSSDNASGAIPAPLEIDEAALTKTQQDIRAKILEADNGYRVRFFTPVRVEIPVSIHAIVSTAFAASDVQAKIEGAVLAEFGENSPASKRGGNRVLYQRIYAMLKEKIDALQSGEADLIVQVGELPNDARQTPEMWRYVSPQSLSVSVENLAAIINSSWR